MEHRSRRQAFKNKLLGRSDKAEKTARAVTHQSQEETQNRPANVDPTRGIITRHPAQNVELATTLPLAASNADSKYHTELSGLGLRSKTRSSTDVSGPRISKDPNVTRNSLWKEAHEIVSMEHPKLIANYESIVIGKSVTTGEDFLNEMESVVELQKHRMENRQWTFEWFGRPQRVRDTLNTVLTLVQESSALVSIGMTLAPVYVALPWSAVCALIPFLMNDTVEYQSAMDGLRHVTCLLSSYRIAETTFLNHEKTAFKFREAVLPLYAKILEYEAAVAQYFGRSTLARWGRALTGKHTWSDLLTELKRLDGNCRSATDFLSDVLVQEGFASLTAIMNQQSAFIDDIVRRIPRLQNSATQVMEWASAITHHNDHRNARKALGADYFASAKWLTRSPEYLSWQSANSGVFHLVGTVGTGKTSAVSIVIDDLMKSGAGPIAYFYCSNNKSVSNARGTAHNETVNIFRSLIAQLALFGDGMALAEPLRREFEKSERKVPGGFDAELDNCIDLLQDIITTHSTDQMTIVLDALDECEYEEEILSSLATLQASQPHLRIFLSSREGIDVEEHLGNVSCVNITTQNADDINTYIVTEIAKRRQKKGLTDHQALRLLKGLTDRAEGMFRWVVLKLDILLASGRSKKHELSDDIEMRIRELEASREPIHQALCTAYHDIYQIAIDFGESPRRAEVVTTALKWTFCTFRTFRLSEIAYICALRSDGTFQHEINENYILEVCSNLLIRTISGEVRPAHFSVREYFEQQLPEEYAVPNQHVRVAVMCLRYSLSNHLNSVGSLPRDTIVDFPESLSKYMTEHWSRHCRESSDDGAITALLDEKHAKETARSNSVLGDDSLHSAIYSNNHAAVHFLLAKKIDITIVDLMGNSALHEAVRLNRVDILHTLLNFKVDLQSRNNNGNTAMHVACFWGNSEALTILLSSGAERNLPNIDGLYPIHIATLQGHENIVKALVASGIDLSAGDDNFDTALHYSVATSQEHMVAILLRNSPNINHRNEHGETALHYAALTGDVDIGRMLCEAGVDLLISDIVGLTPLEVAENLTHTAFENMLASFRPSSPHAEYNYRGQLSRPLTQLCSFCDFDNWMQSAYTGTNTKHWSSYEELLISIRSGCVFCSVIRDGLTRDFQENIIENVKDTELSVRLRLARDQTYQEGRKDLVEISIGNMGSTKLEISLQSNDMELSPFTGRIVPIESSSDASFVVVEQWWNECRNCHINCPKPGPSGLPTRILDIGQSDTEVRLHECTDGEQGEYAYLSYRWGGISQGRPHSLTHATMDDIISGLRIDRMSQTQRDAVTCARRIGLKYVWMDSLCMIHDDRADYMFEVARIPTYLAKATIVLTAASSRHANDGMLKARENVISAVSLDFGKPHPPGGTFSLFIRRPIQTARESMSQIILKHGWMIQEAVLPQRALIYGSEQMYWNCRTALRSEGSVIIENPLLHLTPTYEPADQSEMISSILARWYRLAELYANSQTTMLRDKLFALQGMRMWVSQTLSACVPQACRAEDYIHGLWSNDIARGLLWRVVSPISDRGRSVFDDSLDHIPSWTWAATQGPISYSLTPGLHSSSGHEHSVISISDLTPETFPAWGNQCKAITLSALSRPCSMKLLDRGCEYCFDNIDEDLAWRSGKETTCVLITTWSLVPSRAGSRWIGLIIDEMRDFRGSYRRVGLLYGPRCEENMDAWQMRDFTLV